MNDLLETEVVERIEEALGRALEALEPFESGPVETRLKAGKELVTEADLAVNRALLRVLRREGEGWLSEESVDDHSRLEYENLWIVDPIDGTKEFVAGIPEWCVSVAYVHRGAALAGGIASPATQETFLGSAATGFVYKGSGMAGQGKQSLAGATVLASRSEVKRGEWDRFRDGSFEIVPMGSVAYKLARVAAGLADATWTLTPKREWDVAAGVALVEAAGGFVQTLDYTRPLFNRPDVRVRGLMASVPGIENEMAEFLRPYALPASVPADGRLEAVEAGDPPSGPRK